MNRDLISDLAHARHPVRAPLDDDSVRTLLDHAVPDGEARALDLGCGGGEWLLRALTGHPGLRAEGVDLAEDALSRAADEAVRLGVRDRLTLHRADGAAFRSPHPYDLVLSVGAVHVFGGLLPTLAAARAHLVPGGRVLIGDGFWEREPSPEAVEMLGEAADLATTLDLVAADGWTPVHGHISGRGERDAYEWACWGSLSAWALDHPGHPDSAEILELAARRRTEWLRVYRDSWGFVTLVLRRTAD
ncbi:SAM-dependent methyltransferase [Streptomyces sp. NPDC001478]